MTNRFNSDNANDNNLSGILKEWLQGYIRNSLDDMLPAKVVSYDDKTNRAVVKPLIMIKTTEGARITRSEIPNIPVFRFGGGGFFIRYPLKAGDFGWLKANDRDISLMIQRGGLEDWPNTNRLHNFSDAMFFPDTLKDWAIDDENENALVIQSMDGSVCIALHDNKITMKASELIVDIPETQWNGNISQLGNHTTSGNGVTNGNVTIFGNHTVFGNNVSSNGIFTHNNKDVGATHRHTGVQSGTQTSGEPV